MFVASFAVHAAIRFPTMVRSLRGRTPDEAPGPTGDDGLSPIAPRRPTLSRRAFLGWVGGGSALMVVLTAGQAIGGAARRVALLAPRGRAHGDGPNDFPVNKTAHALRVNGADLSLDHGYPERVIVPANPGVHNTKWVHRLIFSDDDG